MAGPSGLQGATGVTGAAGAPAAMIRWTSFKDILFDFDKSDLRANETGKVSEIATYLQQNPSVKVGIDGHADPRGTDKYNQALSERRVIVIRDALVRAGVPGDKIHTGAFGESRTVCGDATEACWQRDRRVERHIAVGEIDHLGAGAGGFAKLDLFEETRHGSEAGRP